MKIITNNHERQFQYRNEVPEDILSSEFDYQEDVFDGFFQYRDNWYHLDMFMNDGSNMFNGWDGYHSDSFFSGIVIRISDDCETYQVGLYLS